MESKANTLKYLSGTQMPYRMEIKQGFHWRAASAISTDFLEISQI